MIETSRWDSSELLETPEDCAGYIEAVFEDAAETNDYSLLPHALGVVARARGMTEIARETGLSRESLYKALSEDGNPSFATVMKVLQALSIELHAKAKGDTKSGPEAA
jgi:probable addiction module antidote protein